MVALAATCSSVTAFTPHAPVARGESLSVFFFRAPKLQPRPLDTHVSLTTGGIFATAVSVHSNSWVRSPIVMNSEAEGASAGAKLALDAIEVRP